MIPIRGFFLLTVNCSLRTNLPHRRRRTLPGEASVMPFSDSSRVCRSASTAGALFRSGIHLPVLFDGIPLSSADGVVGVTSKAAPPTFLLDYCDILLHPSAARRQRLQFLLRPHPSRRSGADTSPPQPFHLPPRAAPVPRVIPVPPILGLRPPINAKLLAQFLVLLPQPAKLAARSQGIQRPPPDDSRSLVSSLPPRTYSRRTRDASTR